MSTSTSSTSTSFTRQLRQRKIDLGNNSYRWSTDPPGTVRGSHQDSPNSWTVSCISPRTDVTTSSRIPKRKAAPPTKPLPAPRTTITTSKRKASPTASRSSSTKGSMAEQLELAGLIKRGKGVDPKDGNEKVEVSCTATKSCKEKWYFTKVVMPNRPTEHLKTAHPKVKLPAKHYVRTINRVWVHKGTPQSEINASIRGCYDQLSASDKEALQYSKSKSVSKKRTTRGSKSTTSCSEPAAKKPRRQASLLYCEMCHRSSDEVEWNFKDCCGAKLCQGERDDRAEFFTTDSSSCWNLHDEDDLVCVRHWDEAHDGEWWDCQVCRFYNGIEAAQYIKKVTDKQYPRRMKRKDIAPMMQVKCTGECGKKHEVWADAPTEEVKAFVCSNCKPQGGDATCSCNRKWIAPHNLPAR